MNESGPQPRSSRFWKYLIVAAVVFIIALGGLAWYLTTDSFQSLIRARFVNEIETVTGGRVELGSLHTVPFKMRVEVRDLTDPWTGEFH